MTHSYQILQAFHTTEYIYYILIQCILKFATGYQVKFNLSWKLLFWFTVIIDRLIEHNYSKMNKNSSALK